MYARGESNPNRRNRNPLFYPLNYGRKTRIFSNAEQKYNYLRFSPNFPAKIFYSRPHSAPKTDGFRKKADVFTKKSRQSIVALPASRFVFRVV